MIVRNNHTANRMQKKKVKKRVKLKDIAERAEVSISLVSRVLNDNMGNTSASEAIVERIRDVAESMGYSPDTSARSLKTGKTQTIAVVMTIGENYSMSIYTKLLTGIVDGSRNSDYKILYLYFKSEEEEIQALKMLQKMNVDGLLYAPSPGYSKILQEETNEIIRDLTDYGVKVIFCMENFEIPETYCFKVDDYYGGQLAGKYLLDQGAQDVICFGYAMVERVKGLVNTIEAAGGSCTVVECEDYSFEAGYKVAHQMINEGKMTKSIFAVCDLLAQGVCAAIEDHGYDVKTYSIIGYDGLDARKFFRNPIPSIKQPVEDVGRQSVKALIDLIDGKDIASASFLPSFEQ